MALPLIFLVVYFAVGLAMLLTHFTAQRPTLAWVMVISSWLLLSGYANGLWSLALACGSAHGAGIAVLSVTVMVGALALLLVGMRGSRPWITLGGVAMGTLSVIVLAQNLTSGSALLATVGGML